ncbi:hypothetical protein CPter91_3331 [Collimonas pratensis]|uniref:Uncharacterized protein n=1 Tax=Collimonas pratensis TaxID=279113 RepID=A0A127Q6G5_9BURK|nr:hypothetical protein CPter91_3331 [Collimonas pratensis]
MAMSHALRCMIHGNPNTLYQQADRHHRLWFFGKKIID